MSRTSCMGGWCAVRERCGHYRPGDQMSQPVERMCDPRDSAREMFEDGKWMFIPVASDSWEAQRSDRSIARRAESPA